MVRDQALAQIKAGLGFRTGTDLDATILTQLRRAQRLEEMGTDLPWFLIKYDHPLTVAPGAASVLLPADFIREVPHLTARYVVDDQELELKRVPPNQLRAWSRSSSHLAYAASATHLEVAPPTADGLSVLLNYYAKDVVLDQNVENGWLREAPDVLVGAAGALAARHIGNPNAAALFDGIYQAGKSAMLRETFAKQTEAQEFVMGSEA